MLMKTLFEGRTCLVTPIPQTDEKATERIVRFWESLGMKVTCISPEAHDQAVANISHLPQILASSLCAYLGSTDSHWHRFSGGGLRDTSRIASSPPDLWKEIILQNRSFILRAIEGMERELNTVKIAMLEKRWARASLVFSHKEKPTATSSKRSTSTKKEAQKGQEIMSTTLPISPFTKPLTGSVRIPGSKSITNRALLLAALSDESTRLEEALFSEDTEVMVDCLSKLGFKRAFRQ